MLFDAEVLRQFESARLLARRAARGRTAAERRSLHRGSGMEFSEYRAFVPGDDFRRIDWHAYARWRELFVRLLVEEQDWPVHFLLDCSNSMRVGRPPKFDHARRVLGGLAYIALGNHDRVGCALMGSATALAPARGRHRFSTLVGMLEAAEPGAGRTELTRAVSQWLEGRPRRGLVVLVSDGLGTGLEDTAEALGRLRASGQDVALVQVLAPAELEPLPLGEYLIEDIEGGPAVPLIVDAAGQRRFRQRLESFLHRLDSITRQTHAPLLRTLTTESLEAALSRALSWS